MSVAADSSVAASARDRNAAGTGVMPSGARRASGHSAASIIGSDAVTRPALIVITSLISTSISCTLAGSAAIVLLMSSWSTTVLMPVPTWPQRTVMSRLVHSA